MKNWLQICAGTVFSVLIWTGSAHAREVTLKANIPSDWSPENPVPVAFAIDEVTGVWIRTETARRYLQLSKDAESFQAELEMTKQLLTKTNERVVLLENRVALTEEERDVWKYKWTNENSQRVALQEDADIWWKNKWLWFGVGVLVGTGTSYEIVRATHQ